MYHAVPILLIYSITSNRPKFLDQATIYVCFCAQHFDRRLLFVTFYEGFYFFCQEQRMSENKSHMGLIYDWVHVSIPFVFTLLLT